MRKNKLGCDRTSPHSTTLCFQLTITACNYESKFNVFISSPQLTLIYIWLLAVLQRCSACSWYLIKICYIFCCRHDVFNLINVATPLLLSILSTAGSTSVSRCPVGSKCVGSSMCLWRGTRRYAPSEMNISLVCQQHAKPWICWSSAQIRTAAFTTSSEVMYISKVM